MTRSILVLLCLAATVWGQGGQGFGQADADGDGRVTAKEFKAYASSRLRGQDDAFFTKLFKAVDKNADGALSKDEFAKRHDALSKMRGGAGGGERRPPDGKRDLKDKEADYDKVARRAAKRDHFPAFDEPEMLKAKDAKLEDDEAVIGVFLDGEARAYPIAVMGKHELGNDVCGQTPIAVSW